MCSCCKEPETTLHYLLRCNLYSIYRLELLNDICALKGSLENSSEEKLLRIVLYGAEDFTSQMNSEILKCTIKFIKKTDRFSGPLFFFFFFFTLSKYLAYNMFSMSLMFLCLIYVHNLQWAVYVFCKFCVLCRLVLFAFIFNIFVTSESMCSVIKKNPFQKTVVLAESFIFSFKKYIFSKCNFPDNVALFCHVTFGLT